MKQIIMIMLFCTQYAGICRAQSAILNFRTDQIVRVDLYEPIDLSYQNYVVSRHFELVPQVEIKYQLSVSDFKFVNIKIGGKKTVLILTPGDTISLQYKDRDINILGTNAEGHRYYNKQFIWHGTMPILSKLQHDIIQFDNYTEFDQHFERTIVSPINEVIDSLRNSNFISSEFSSILHREINDYLYSGLMSSLLNSYLNKSLTQEHITQIQAILNTLHGRFSKNDDVYALKLNLGSDYLDVKYQQLYKKMSEEEKNKLCGEYSRETFGAYAKWLLAPDSIQMTKLSYALWIQHAYAANELDANKLLSYLQTKFPKSDAVVYLSQIYGKPKTVETLKGPEYILDPIKSLGNLSTVNELSGKYCLVDIWATWCIPCRQEFLHHKDLRKLLEDYDNIALLYISIDESKIAPLWKKMVQQLDLQGFHLLASPQLVENIKTIVFNSNNILIPRYILLSPTGEILNPDMPRIESINDLQQVLNKYLK